MLNVIEDLSAAGCDIITIGQYLQPSRRKWPVKEFISHEQFHAYEQYGSSLVVKQMVCGPFVSDYHASLLRIWAELYVRRLDSEDSSASTPSSDHRDLIGSLQIICASLYRRQLEEDFHID